MRLREPDAAGDCVAVARNGPQPVTERFPTAGRDARADRSNVAWAAVAGADRSVRAAGPAR